VVDESGEDILQHQAAADLVGHSGDEPVLRLVALYSDDSAGCTAAGVISSVAFTASCRASGKGNGTSGQQAQTCQGELIFLHVVLLWTCRSANSSSSRGCTERNPREPLCLWLLINRY